MTRNTHHAIAKARRQRAARIAAQWRTCQAEKMARPKQMTLVAASTKRLGVSMGGL
jgi:hypothetical protein